MADKKTKSKAIWDSKIVRGAILDSLLKLDPRHMMGNPVMFVVEIGSVITSVLLAKDIAQHGAQVGFNLQITLWLWFTVLFANFAEAMAEGRGKAQADALRKARSESVANRLLRKRFLDRSYGRATWSWCWPESSFLETARSSKALRLWMSRPSRESRRR